MSKINVEDVFCPPDLVSKSGKESDKRRITREIKEILQKGSMEPSPYLDIMDSSPPSNRSKATSVIVDMFLHLYATFGTMAAACNYLPISTDTIVQLKRKHPRFADACKNSLLEFQASLIEEATRRGRDGVEETVYFKDQKIGTKVVYSDRLMEKLLDGFGGDRFKKAVESNGPGGVQVNIMLSDGTVMGDSNGDNKPTIQLQTTALPDAGVEVHGEETSRIEEE